MCCRSQCYNMHFMPSDYCIISHLFNIYVPCYNTNDLIMTSDCNAGEAFAESDFWMIRVGHLLI